MDFKEAWKNVTSAFYDVKKRQTLNTKDVVLNASMHAEQHTSTEHPKKNINLKNLGKLPLSRARKNQSRKNIQSLAKNSKTVL